MNLIKKFKGYSEKSFLKIFTFIRAKLILAFLVPVSFIIILGLLSYFKSKEGLIESYEGNTLSNVTNLSKYLDFGFDIASSKAAFLANDKVLKSYYSGYYKEDNMEELSRYREVNESVMSSIISSDYISNMYILSGYGKSISCKGTVGSKLDYDDFIKNGEGALLEKDNKKEMWIGTHSYLDKLSSSKENVYAVSYLKYLYGSANKQIGCIAVDISYNFVHDILAGSGMPDGSAIAFITKDGREIVNGKLPENFKFTEQKYYSKAVNGKNNAAYEYITLNKDNYLFVFSKIQTSDSLLCAVIPNSIIVKQASRVKSITLNIVIIASILAIVLGAFMASGFSTAIHRIIQVLKKTETGDLTCSASVKRRDEFAILGRSINDMIGSMMKLIKKMSGISTTLSQSASSVSESSAVLVDATQNITQAVGDIEQGITQQAAESGKCLQQMGDLAERINAVYDNTHNIEQIAGNTKNIVSNGMEIVDNLGKKANNTAVITKDVITDIENLAKESGAVRKIIETINEIAEQTNLLSLNASIEAARAGEAGRGFAVVADEIRKLADQSVKSSGEIGAIIKRIEEQTKKTVTTAKYAESIVSSQQDALNGTINAFADINSHVEKLTDNLNRIVNDIEGIENAKNDTLGAIESISATSEETAAAAEQLGVTAQKQMDQVNKLNDVVKQLGSDAENMEESVSVFKVE